MGKKEIEETITKIKQNPREFVAQPLEILSTIPTISENAEEEPLLEEDFSVALLEDDQRDFEAGMVVSTSKVGILWGKKSLNSLRFPDFLS